MRGSGPALALLAAAALGAAACGPETSGTPVAELFREQCASCHGDDGRGHPARRRLEPALDLTRSRLVAQGSRGLIHQRISWGWDTMPGFSHKLPPGDIALLVEFVEGLQETR